MSKTIKRSKSKFFIVLVMLLLLLVTVSLVACKKDDDEKLPDDGKDNTVTKISAVEAIEKLSGSITGGASYTSLDFSSDIKIGEKDGKVEVGFNFGTKDNNGKFLIKDDNGEITFGIYIVNDKIYLDLGNNKKLYLEDITAQSIIDLLNSVPSYDELNDLLGSLVGMDGILDMVVSMFISKCDVVIDGTTEIVTMNFSLESIKMLIDTVLPSLNIDGMLAGLGVNLNGSLEDLIKSIVIPDITVLTESKIVSGKYNGTTVKINQEDESLFAATCIMQASNTPLDLELPADVTEFVPFNLTRLQFNAELQLEANQFNVGQFISLFTDSIELPSNIVINTSVGFELSVAIKLNLQDNANNLIKVELTEKGSTKVLAGVYYYDGVMYVNLEQLIDVPSGSKIPNYKIEGMNITNAINNLFSSIGKTIGETFNKEVDGTQIMSVSSTESGYVISPDVISFAKSVLNLLGINDFVTINGDSINIEFSKALFDAIKTVIPSIDVSMPDFGIANIAINLSQYGLDNIDIDYNAPNNNANENLSAKLVFKDFMYGYYEADLKSDIETAINQRAYVSNITDIIFDAMKGMSITGTADVNVEQGTYNLADILRIFDLDVPNLPLTISSDLNLTVNLDIKLNLDKANPSNSKFLAEVTVKEGGNTKKLIGLYYQDGWLYADLSGIVVSNISMPKVKAQINLAEMLIDEINKLDTSALLANDSVSTVSVTNSGLAELNDLISLNVNMNSLMLKASSIAISRVLKELDINIDLPYFDIKAEITSINGLIINVGSATEDITVDIQLGKLIFGTVQEIEIDTDLYNTSYENIMEALLNKALSFEAEGNMTLYTGNSKMDVTSLINKFLAPSNMKLDVPILIETSEYSTDLRVKLAWNIYLSDVNPDINGNVTNRSEFLLELDADNNKVLYVYYRNGLLYLDLSSFGLKQYVIANSGVIELINSMLSDVNMSEFNLTEMLNRLFAGGGDVELPPVEGGDSDTTIDLIEWLLQGVSINDTEINLTLTKALMESMLLGLGIDAGININTSISIDLPKGEIAINLQLDEVKLKGRFSLLGLGVYNQIDFDKLMSELAKDSYLDLSISDAGSFVDGLLNALEFQFEIDIITNSIDTSNDKTRIRIEKATETTTRGAMTLQKNDILVTIFNGWTSDENSAWVYVGLKLSANSIQILGTKNWFDVSVANGSALNISIDMDVKTILVDLLAPIFAPFSSDTKDIVAPTSDSASLEIAINSVVAKLMPNGDISIAMSINGAAIHSMLVDTVTTLFTNLDIGSMLGKTTPHLVTIEYNDTDYKSFFNELWTKALRPVVLYQANISDNFITAAVVDYALKDKFHALVRKVLPLPKFNEITVEANIIDGQFNFANIKIENYVDGVKDNANGFDITIYNKFEANTVNWNGQDPSIEFNANGVNDLKNYLVTDAKRQFAGGYTSEVITWQLRNADNELVTFTLDDLSLFKNETGEYIAGTYSVVATAFGQTMDISININAIAPVSVKDITVKAFDELPTYVDVTYSDGEVRRVGGISIVADAGEGVGERVVVGKVIIDGIEMTINITFEEETINITDETILLNAYNYKSYINGTDSIRITMPNGAIRFVSASFDWSKLNNLTEAEALAGGIFEIPVSVASNHTEHNLKLNIKLESREVDYIKFDSGRNHISVTPNLDLNSDIDSNFPNKGVVVYKDGFEEQIALTWDTSGLEYSINGNVGKVMVSNTDGDVKWSKEISVDVLSSRIISPVFGAERKSSLTISLYEYLSDGLPKTITFSTASEVDVTLAVEWNLDGIYIENTDSTQVLSVTAGGGRLSNATMAIQVNFVADNVLGLVNDTITVDSFAMLYNNASIDQFLTEFLEFNTSTGVKSYKVAWSTKNINLSVDGGTQVVQVTVGIDRFAKTFDINVVTTSSKITHVAGTENIELDINEYNNNAGAFFPMKYTVMVNGEEKIVYGTWNLDGVVFEVGNTYEVIFTIVGDIEQALSFTVTVVDNSATA